MQFLKEMVLLVLVREFREHLPVVSEVVDQGLKGAAVPIEEDFIVNFLELVHFGEHFGEERLWHRLQDRLLGLNMNITSDVETDDFASQIHQVLDGVLLLLLSVALDLDKGVLLVHFVLHIDVKLLHKSHIGLDLVLDLLVLHRLVFEIQMHVGDVLSEGLFKLSHTNTPD